MRYERFCINAILLMAIACSRETPAPPAAPAAPTQTAATTSGSAPVATKEPAARTGGSYKEAMVWLRSAPAFHFTLDENGIHAEGELARRTIGAESVRVRANGEEWRATAGTRGVAWELRKGNAWKAASAPAYGNRLYQRVTLAFDPQKKEGDAQFVAAEGTANHYRFTDANTAEVHDVWVNAVDNHVERMKIGDSFEMKLKIEN
jgi:hypothetical protein